MLISTHREKLGGSASDTDGAVGVVYLEAG